MTININATLATLSAALLAPASAVANALAKAENHKQAWAIFCAKGLQGKKPSLTMEQIEAALVDAINAKQGKRNQIDGLASASKLIGGRMTTLYGWYRDLSRVHAAGDSVLTQLTGPEPVALTTLARGVRPMQPKATSKGGKGNQKVAVPVETPAAAAPSAPVAPTLSLKAVRTFLVDLRKQGTAKAIASQEADLSVIVQEAGNLVRMVEAYRAEQARLKAAAPAKRVRKAA